ncbi:MAG: aminotransferase class V-fold PLP-dependent enzyme [Bacteroidales bacterium]|nr:aminotransferase class V-fold PLP-dependent enzyme [Bacteroidales bacterium]
MSDFIYLDNSATAFPKPDEVYDFMNKFYRENGVSPGRSGYDMALEAEMVVTGTRKMLTKMFNGTDHERLIFSYNASEALNMVFDGLLRKGDHVVTTNLEHNSVLRPLYHKSIDGVAETTYVPFDSRGYMNPDDIKAAIKKNTRMVVINHASNVIGTVQPIEEIGKICKEAGVIFAVDASQSAGLIKIDMQAMCIDVLAFTGHKCLMGPTGTGGLCVSEDLDINGTRFGGTGVRSAVKTHLTEFPYRLECGTMNIVGISGLYAGQKWINEKGMENIHMQEITLWEKLRKGIQDIKGVTTYCADSPENHIAVLSFNINGFEAGDVGTMLDVDYDIATRTGLHCAPLVHEQMGTKEIHGTVRFGIGPFNTEDHINKAIKAVGEIASIKN